MSLIKLKSVTPKHVFDIDLIIDDDNGNTYNYKMRKLGEFEYGNDEDIDTILYPANVKIEFTFTASDIPLHFGGGTYNDYRNFEKEYFNLINKFSFLDTSVIIYKDGDVYFNGFIDKKNKTANFEERTIELTALSDFSKLKDIDPRSLNPLDFDSPALLTDYIKRIINLAIPAFDDIVLITDIQSQTDFYLGPDYWIAPASRFGQESSRFFGSYCDFTSCSDLIKAICSSLGCLAILKNNTFYIISRWYFSSESPITLRTREMIQGEAPKPTYSKKLDGLRIKVKGNPSLPVPKTHYYNYGNVDMLGDEVLNDSEVELIETMLIGGTSPAPDPEIDAMWILTLPEFGTPQWINNLPNSFYGGIIDYANRTALWDVVGSNIWDQIQYDRLVYQLEAKGTDWQYDKFYQFENGLADTFRPRKLKYNYPNESTVLDLIKC